MIRNRARYTITATAFLALSLTACGGSAAENNLVTPPVAASPGAAAPLASLANLTGNDTQVELEASFLTALTSLGVTPGVLGTATLTGSTLAFPITGGNVDYYTPGSRVPYVTGLINHGGSGLSLTAGATIVELTDFQVDPGTSLLKGTVTVNGDLVGDGVNLFNLDGTTLEPLVVDEAARTGVLFGTKVLLHPDAAAALSGVFNAEVPADLLVGTARITVALPDTAASPTEIDPAGPDADPSADAPQ